MKQTYGFGVVVNERPIQQIHHFKIINDKNGPVELVESFVEHGTIKERTRAKFEKNHWDILRPIVEREFNDRLKRTGSKTARFKQGTTYIDRFLGRELAMLASACETANITEVASIANNWLCWSPEERWWSYRKILGDPQRWSKILYLALAA